MTPGRTSPFHTRISQVRADLFAFCCLPIDNTTLLDEFLKAFDSRGIAALKTYSMVQMTGESAECDDNPIYAYAPEKERIAWPGTGSPEHMAGVQWLIRRMVSNALRTFLEEGPARMR